jgi:hypothetical protein
MVQRSFRVWILVIAQYRNRPGHEPPHLAAFERLVKVADFFRFEVSDLLSRVAVEKLAPEVLSAMRMVPVLDRVPSKDWRVRARWKHGLYSAEALAERKRVRELLTQSRELLKQLQAD